MSRRRTMPANSYMDLGDACLKSFLIVFGIVVAVGLCVLIF